jgi:two-component system phosphate regulon sensor histidine kinase PhoR
MRRFSYRARLFAAALISAVLGLIVAGGLFAESVRAQMNARIEETLVNEARTVADLLARTPASTGIDLQDEAVGLGRRLGARVTLIAPDGHVVGDSAETGATLETMENHGTRPEVIAARASGLGEERRHSATLDIDMLYVACPVGRPDLAFVRLALPLTDIRAQLWLALRSAALALIVALGGAAVMAWILSGRLGARVRVIAGVAQRYREGDLSPSPVDYGTDELGIVARALDDSIHELGGRLAELARDRARMAAILRSVTEGVIVIDAHGHIELANAAAGRLLQLDDVTGHHYLEVIRHPAIGDLLTAALHGRTPAPVEVSPSHDPARTLMAGAAPAVDGRAFGAALVLHDITELRRVDRIRRDFVANVSHELRTPLTAIRGYVELLADDVAEIEGGRQAVEVILRQTSRMERLLNDLLRLARLDAGQDTLQPVTCDSRTLLAGLVEELSTLTADRNQRIETVIDQDAGSLTADAAKIRDALRNLLVNAVRYSPTGTTVRIEISHADRPPDAARGDDSRENRHSRQRSGIAIAVSDQGPGIPEEDLPRIFERFYRVDRSRARDPGGTGLGLAIVKHLVELHGGTVTASNLPPTGTRVTIWLPQP